MEPNLRLWDLESGKEIAIFTADTEISSCAATSGGRTIIAGDWSGRVHFLKLKTRGFNLNSTSQTAS